MFAGKTEKLGIRCSRFFGALLIAAFSTGATCFAEDSKKSEEKQKDNKVNTEKSNKLKEKQTKPNLIEELMKKDSSSEQSVGDLSGNIVVEEKNVADWILNS